MCRRSQPHAWGYRSRMTVSFTEGEGGCGCTVLKNGIEMAKRKDGGNEATAGVRTGRQRSALNRGMKERRWRRGMRYRR